MSYAALLEAFTAAALEAGAIILKHYEAGAEARTKVDKSPVTDADEEAEVAILKHLKVIEPETPVLAEEAVADGGVPKAMPPRFFLVDPLDGTKEFLRRNGEFTVNIALAVDGAPVAGVVYAPALGVLYSGAAGEGASRADVRDPASENPKLMPPEPLHAAPVPPSGIVAVASRSHRDTKTDEYLSHYEIADLKSAGSSLKFCLVASGEAHLYPRHGPTMEWDTAAGHAVLWAAGGSVERLDGSAFEYGKAAEGFKNPGFVAWAKRG